MFAPGNTITNGFSALRIVDNDQGQAHALYLALGADEAADTGTPVTMPLWLLEGWRHLPFGWRPVAGQPLEERYCWAGDHRWLKRSTRPATRALADARRLVKLG